jgi:tRNA modification GTPase
MEMPIVEFHARVDALLAWADFGLHLTRPWHVVLTGRPNVGKSSLINALLGYSRSIVYDEPGTTRDIVTAETAIAGWPVRLIDTAGIRQAAEGLEAAGIERAHESLASADCVIVVCDVGSVPEAEDVELLASWPGATVAGNKSDLPNMWGERLPENALCVSSRTGAGLDTLVEAIAARLVPELPPAGTPIPITERQVALLRQARSALENGDKATAKTTVARLFRG